MPSHDSNINPNVSETLKKIVEKDVEKDVDNLMQGLANDPMAQDYPTSPEQKRVTLVVGTGLYLITYGVSDGGHPSLILRNYPKGAQDDYEFPEEFAEEDFAFEFYTEEQLREVIKKFEDAIPQFEVMMNPLVGILSRNMRGWEVLVRMSQELLEFASNQSLFKGAPSA